MKELIVATLLALSLNANATVISSSYNCPGDTGCDTSVTANYGFDISVESTDNLTWSFELENTSGDVNPVIDLFSINMNAILGEDFSVLNFNPDTWTFTVPTGGGVQFDYIGDSNTPGSRLGQGESLVFDFLFNTETDYTVFTEAPYDAGTGIGGGTDFGQFLVSFQTLGWDGEDSDLIGGSWNYSIVPEPSILVLMSLGLVGLGIAGIRREERKQILLRKI